MPSIDLPREVELWGEDSFLVELKPNTAVANFFISCPSEGESGVKIEAGGIWVGTDGGRRRTGRLEGLRLEPETVSCLAWADKGRLLTGRLRAETPDIHLGTQSSFVLSRQIRGPVSLDALATALGKEGGCVLCAHCQEPLVPSTLGLGHVGSLPSDDWLDDDAHPDVSPFCCLHNGHGANGHDEESPALAPRAAPTPAHGLILSDSHFLVPGSLSLDSLSLDDCGELLRCQHCAAHVGLIVHHGDSALYKLFHSAAAVRISGGPSFISQRFQSEERYFAWLLLSKCHQSGSLKLLLKSLDGTPKILVWLLDSYALMAVGTLSAEAEAGPEPFTALKLLYKLYSDSAEDSDDGRLRGEDYSLTVVTETSGAIGRLSRALLRSSQTLPPPTRALGQFLQGYLPIARLGSLMHF